MDNPTLIKKIGETPPVVADVKKLFQVVYTEKKQKEEEESDPIPKIKVSSFLSKMSFYYEKIRNSVDYKEDHLFRKNAIERILKRELIIQGSIKAPESNKVSEHLLTELIRASYLPDNKIPEIKIDEIGRVVEKYIKFKDYILDYKDYAKGTTRNELVNWIIMLAACDIEERLSSSEVNKTIIKGAYDILNDIIDLPPDSSYSEDREIQIYIAIERKILKFDNAMISFVLFKYYNQKWSEAIDEQISYIAENLDVLKDQIDEQIDHPFRAKLNRIASIYALFFTILTEVVQKNPKETYYALQRGFKTFSFEIKKVCNQKYKRARSRLWRAGVRSIIYIFITKSIFVFILEIPAMKWLGESVNNTTLAINIGFPPLLLFLVILFTRLPSEKNTKKIINGIEEIMFRKERRAKQVILKKPVKRGRFMSIMFGLIYMITFFSSFGLIIWGLTKIDFHFVSIIIFLFFLAFISFFSIRIRRPIHELKVLEPSDNIFSFFVDFFYMPIVATGKWLSEKFDKINIFVFVLDFIIEAPFKTFVQIAEEWTKYVREKKDEIV